MLIESTLTEAGVLFFAAWSVIVAVVTLKAFWRDLLPTKAASTESYSWETWRSRQCSRSRTGEVI